jgi:hypothetical protein
LADAALHCGCISTEPLTIDEKSCNDDTMLFFPILGKNIVD